MKKVLVNTGRLTIGGLENMVVSFAENTGNKYKYYFIVHNNTKVEYEDRIKNISGNILRVNNNNIFRYIVEIKEIMKKYGPFDVVHSHTLFFSGVVLSIAKLYKVPIRIAHSHSTNTGNKESLKNIIIHKILQIMIKVNGNVFCACGQKAGRYLYGTKFWNKNGTLIENGIDTRKFSFSVDTRTKIRRELGISENEFLIGQVGRIVPVKNFDFTIKIFQKIVQNNQNIKLLFVGDGPERESLEEKVEKSGLRGKIQFLGNVTNMNEIYSALDILLMPSLYEGFPVVLVEAQVNGLRCLISNKISKEVMLTNLITAKELREEVWIKEINKMINETNFEHRNDYMKLLMNYDIKNVAKKIEEIYG